VRGGGLYDCVILVTTSQQQVNEALILVLSLAILGVSIHSEGFSAFLGGVDSNLSFEYKRGYIELYGTSVIERLAHHLVVLLPILELLIEVVLVLEHEGLESQGGGAPGPHKVDYLLADVGVLLRVTVH